jgi:hypothetical protein
VYSSKITAALLSLLSRLAYPKGFTTNARIKTRDLSPSRKEEKKDKKRPLLLTMEKSNNTKKKQKKQASLEPIAGL